uniref:Uncharacterized protein n=1 Tax=Cannabis sativa TaxID=3483 RepID=A0A803QXT3_CANSA
MVRISDLFVTRRRRRLICSSRELWLIGPKVGFCLTFFLFGVIIVRIKLRILMGFAVICFSSNLVDLGGFGN